MVLTGLDGARVGAWSAMRCGLRVSFSTRAVVDLAFAGLDVGAARSPVSLGRCAVCVRRFRGVGGPSGAR